MTKSTIWTILGVIAAVVIAWILVEFVFTAIVFLFKLVIVAIVEHQAADLMNPARFLVAGSDHLDDHFRKAVTGHHPLDRIIIFIEPVIVAVTQLEARAIFVDGRTKLPDLPDPVHRQCGIVGPQQRLVRIDQDDAFVQPRDDLAQVAEIYGFPQRFQGCCHGERLIATAVDQPADRLFDLSPDTMRTTAPLMLVHHRSPKKDLALRARCGETVRGPRSRRHVGRCRSANVSTYAQRTAVVGRGMAIPTGHGRVHAVRLRDRRHHAADPE